MELAGAAGFEPANAGTKNRSHQFREIWLGRQDSNLRMPVPKTGALPLGDAPAGVSHVAGEPALIAARRALQRGMGRSLPTHYVTTMAEPSIRDFHAHIYYDPEEVEHAKQ